MAPARASAQSSICYAASGGNDTNDGSYWAFAKADIMSCYEALPDVGGTIYIKDDIDKTGIPACKPSDPPGCGIWIMGQRDPNYVHPAAGWRRSKRAVNFIGVAGNTAAAFALGPQVKVAGGGNDSDHPNLWLSDTQLHSFYNINFVYGHTPILIGVDSKGSAGDTGTSSWSWLFQNVSAGPRGYFGYGPAVTVGTNSVWGFFRDCSLNGNTSETVGVASVNRSSNQVTVTTSRNLPSSWSGEMSIGIVGVHDSSFNGLFTATITGTNTFIYAQEGEEADSAGGIASSDKAQAMVLNPGPGHGDGLIFVETSWFGGGGIRAYHGSAIYVRDTWQENGFAPPVDVFGCPVGLGDRAINIHNADRRANIPGIRVNASNCINPAVVETANVDGPAFLAGSAGPSESEILPDAEGQSGIYGNRVFAQVDTPRRAFGPVAARYKNLANQLPSAWALGGAAHRGGIVPALAPDGTMNAGTIYCPSGNADASFYRGKRALSVGDWIIGGAWARSDKGNGLAHSSAIVLVCGDCKLSDGRRSIAPSQGIGGNGEWEWVWFATQAETSGTYPLIFDGVADSTHPTDFFAPILICIPGGTVSRNEAEEIALHLQSYREDASVGQVSLLHGEQFKADSIQVGDGPTISSGMGPPKGSGTVGSIYLRGDGAPGSTFYIYEKDGWKAKF
jgi:hypothetical protein